MTEPTQEKKKKGALDAGGMAEVQKWTSKLPLKGLLAGETDGRSVSGMEKALLRMDEKDEDRMAVANLKSLCKLVKLCQHLCKAPIRTMPQDELDVSFQQLEAAKVELPEAMMSALLTRRIGLLVEAGDMSSLLECMNPFAAAPDAGFDFRKPVLRAVSNDLRARLDFYNKTIFEKVVLDMMKAGSAKSEALFQFAVEAAAKLDEVDLVELCSSGVKELNEHLAVWRCLIALLSDTMNVDLQDLS